MNNIIYKLLALLTQLYYCTVVYTVIHISRTEECGRFSEYNCKMYSHSEVCGIYNTAWYLKIHVLVVAPLNSMKCIYKLSVVSISSCL